MNSVVYAFPTTGIFTGWEHKNLNDGGIYRYQGGDPSNSLVNWLLVGGELSSDPDTSSWGVSQQGAQWYNTTEQQWKGWDGSQIVLVG